MTNRKAKGAALALFALFCGLIMTVVSPEIAPAYGTFSTAVVALFTAYAFGNVAAKYLPPQK